MSLIARIIAEDAVAMEQLRAVRSLGLPDWCIAAGFVRNRVWDHLHGYACPTPVADVDVAFFDPDDLRREREEAIERELFTLRGDVPWDVKNQAAVHCWYETVFGVAVPPLTSIEDAVSSWPETATCVAVRLQTDGDLLVLAPHGLDDLFQLLLRWNPRRSTLELFRRRVREKEIERKWPRVRILEG